MPLPDFFFAPKSGKKLRADVAARAKAIRKKIEDNNVDETIREIFDDVSEKTTEAYNSAKDMMSEKIAEVTETVATIDHEKYLKIVTDVVSTVKKDKGVAEGSLIKLKKYLENDFTKLKPVTPVKKKPTKTVKRKTPKKATKKA